VGLFSIYFDYLFGLILVGWALFALKTFLNDLLGCFRDSRFGLAYFVGRPKFKA
jgi:hypothetical protein